MTGPAAEGDSVAPMKRYRETLELRYAEASTAYDKAVMTLAGGGLAVSMAFIKDIAPNPVAGSTIYLRGGWLALSLSLGAILLALLFSQWALRWAIRQVDQDQIRGRRAGGKLALATTVLNAGAGILFLAGVVLLIIFATMNMGDTSREGQEESGARVEATRQAGEAGEAGTKRDHPEGRGRVDPP